MTPEQQATPVALNQIDINADGMYIIRLLAPGLQLMEVIDPATMDGICKKWLEVRKQSLNVSQFVRKHPRG